MCRLHRTDFDRWVPMETSENSMGNTSVKCLSCRPLFPASLQPYLLEKVEIRSRRGSTEAWSVLSATSEAFFFFSPSCALANDHQRQTPLASQLPDRKPGWRARCHPLQQQGLSFCQLDESYPEQTKQTHNTNNDE